MAIECIGSSLPATGQTTCYDTEGNVINCGSAEWPGQDGFYQAGCPSAGRFVDNGDGTVTDSCTGLVWQKDTADVNGDGRPDLVTANQTDGSVSVLLNLGAAPTDVGPALSDLPQTLRLLASRPNPARGSSEIRLLLPSACTVDVVLFDLAGRRVRSLAAGEPMTPGEHGLRWDGRDGFGVPVRDGVYLVRARAGSEVAVGKVVVLR